LLNHKVFSLSHPVISFKLKTLFFCIFLYCSAKGQSVGVVLSGGGASGIAHIGVLKALEENNIPIDYIAGSSEGALIGALYAAGYSPLQLEKLFNSAEFKDMSQGVIDSRYQYYFKRGDDDASWISFKLAFDSSITSVLPTNLISPVPIDFGLMELFGAPAAAARYNFDSLFIPFRCVAAEIENKETVVFNSGDLAEAVRASITYPFYISPIRVNGKLLFDGGLYNNFPSNIMYNDFFPDIIIGSNVGANTSPVEDDLFSQIKCMLQNKSDYTAICENGIIITPYTTVSTFDFKNPQPVIDSGYAAAIRQMEQIKILVERRVSDDELAVKRIMFKAKQPDVVFNQLTIVGLNSKQGEYARRILQHKQKQVTLRDIKEGYYRLAGDSKLKSIYPKAVYNPKTGYYDLYLNIKKEKELITHLGGVFSNKPISEGYIGLQYNYLSSFASSFMANAYFGKLYNSAQLKARFDFPLKTPFYIEPGFTWNSWDYYKSSNAFINDAKPPYLKIKEEYGHLNVGFPTGKKGRIVTGVGLLESVSYYYQTNNFKQQDTADHTDLNAFTSQLYYEVNSLNRKQYASEGERILFKVRHIKGNEVTIPGNTSADTVSYFEKLHEWIQLKFMAEKYFNRRGAFKFGVMGEAAYSTQTAFQNYSSSILVAPAFLPIPDSRTVFMDNYRAYKYFAGGVKFIMRIRKNLEFRTEGYIFQPYQTLLKTEENKVRLSKPFEFRNFVGTGGVVWHTPVGPMSLSMNYYSSEKNPITILYHFGYIIFNNRSID
jgi:NTE family protein